MLIGYCFPKTGSTALLVHLSRHLGRAVYAKGPFSDLKRIQRGEPLLEELGDEELKSIRVIIGHGVHAGIAARFPGSMTFSVIREPGARFVSAYGHAIRHRTDFPKTAREFLDTLPSSPFLTAVTSRFGSVTNIDSVFQSEHLSSQSAEAFRSVGAPPLEGRYRVSDIQPDLGDLSLDEVRLKDHLDVALHRQAPLFGTPCLGEPSAVERSYLEAIAVSRYRGTLDKLKKIVKKQGTDTAKKLLLSVSASG